MKLEHRLSYMALIGNLSPMIGLFGTVQGMIKSFEVIANGGSTPKPSELARWYLHRVVHHPGGLGGRNPRYCCLQYPAEPGCPDCCLKWG